MGPVILCDSFFSFWVILLLGCFLGSGGSSGDDLRGREVRTRYDICPGASVAITSVAKDGYLYDTCPGASVATTSVAKDGY